MRTEKNKVWRPPAGTPLNFSLYAAFPQREGNAHTWKKMMLLDSDVVEGLFFLLNNFHAAHQGAVNSAASKEICTLGLFSGDGTKAFARLKSQQTKTRRRAPLREEHMQTHRVFCCAQIDLIRKNVHAEALCSASATFSSKKGKRADWTTRQKKRVCPNAIARLFENCHEHRSYSFAAKSWIALLCQISLCVIVLLYWADLIKQKQPIQRCYI